MVSLWDRIVTMSFEDKYYGCCDVNDDHTFHGFIIWDEYHNLQDNFPWAFIKWLKLSTSFYIMIAMVYAIVMFKKHCSSFKWNNYNIIFLPSVNNLGFLIK